MFRPPRVRIRPDFAKAEFKTLVSDLLSGFFLMNASGACQKGRAEDEPRAALRAVAHMLAETLKGIFLG